MCVCDYKVCNQSTMSQATCFGVPRHQTTQHMTSAFCNSGLSHNVHTRASTAPLSEEFGKYIDEKAQKTSFNIMYI